MRQRGPGHRLIKYSLGNLRPIRTAEAFEAVDRLHQLRYFIKTAKHRITEIMPHDRSWTLVFKRVVFEVAGFLLTSASCSPSAIAELLVLIAMLYIHDVS